MPKLRVLRLAQLVEAGTRIRLSPGFRAYLLETTKVCLDDNSHSSGARLKIDGKYRRSYRLAWEPATDEDRRTCQDMEVTTEHAAYAVAFLLMIDVTDHHVISRSAKGTGFDYWLGEPQQLGFQEKARLEVSGLLANPRGVSARAIKKLVQTQRSDHVMMPAFVVIVEFSAPMARIAIR